MKLYVHLTSELVPNSFLCISNISGIMVRIVNFETDIDFDVKFARVNTLCYIGQQSILCEFF
jgi:hypothetical protein